VAELLSFSRREDMPKQCLSPVPVIKEVLKLLRVALPKCIEIEQNISTECPSVFISPVELHQVIMNLVTNAYHAIGDRPGKISVTLKTIDVDIETSRTHPGLNPGLHVCLSVSDDGPGIRGDILHRIFDPYFTTKEEGKGTGLGLTVVHNNIVHTARGVVSVYTEVGRGTTFRCYFPASQREADLCETPELEIPPAQFGLHVMVVDDDELNLAITSEMFTHLGCDVEAFTDPQKALTTFQKRPDDFDLLFIDQIMPKMNGIDLVIAIKRISDKTPTVIASGYPVALRERAIKEAGVSAVLTKPFTLMELKDTLKRLTGA